MQSHDLAGHKQQRFPLRAMRLFALEGHHDPMLLFGIPLLLLTGAILGVINIVAWINVVAAALGG
jgi:hypothetical protein